MNENLPCNEDDSQPKNQWHKPELRLLSTEETEGKITSLTETGGTGPGS